MSRTTLCVITAAALAAVSLGAMAARWCILGDEVRRPIGPSTWKVTLTVQGASEGNARVFTATPLELDRQRVVDDAYESDELHHKPPEARHPERRRVVWSQRNGPPAGEVRARSEFLISLNKARQGGSAPSSGLYAAPAQGEHLGDEPLIEARHDAVTAKARALTADLEGSTSQLDAAQALFHFVEQKVRNDVRLDRAPVSALGCLEAGKGDRAAKARLLAALLRNRNVPARLVTGVTLAKGPEQQAHYWVEAFVYDHWMPMDPYHRLFGRVPSTYVVFGFGDRAVVTAKRVTGLKSAFLVEKVGHEGDADEPAWRRTLKGLSLYQLPPGDRRLVEVLLLMPVAALVVSVFRNVVGLGSFGTFTPALIGLAFHDLNSWPGMFVFVSILLVGWLMRRFLDGYHLLQVPRVALMLTLIMSVLIVLIVTCNQYGSTPTRYVSLFPLVILTGMVERFWTLETEDSTAASFKTLLQTMFIALVIAVLLGRPFLVKHLFCFPETLGVVMALQLLLGRYTGYRLTELFRFRDFLKAPPGYVTT
jgi:hypothetical protein